MGPHHVQIGEVADQTGLSLRTIRYYEEVGLIMPSARTTGGFRLYADSDVSRLLMIKRMKPLDFSLEEMGDVLNTLDGHDAHGSTSIDDATRIERLEMYRDVVKSRVAALKEQLEVAEGFASDLRREIGRQKKRAGQR